MTDFDIQKIVENYRESISLNLDDINSEIIKNPVISEKEILSLFQELLSNTSYVVSERWLKKEKYLRTKYTLSVFGESFPQDRLTLSLCVDAMVNILDDFYDEALTKKQKQIYLIELLRVISIINQNIPSLELSVEFGKYFDKLITLAVCENFNLKQMKENLNDDFVISTGASLLLTRAYDMDIFVQIAESNNSHNTLLMEFRLLRALSILKKDILDLKRDIETDQESIVTFVFQSNLATQKILIDISNKILTNKLLKINNIPNKLSDMINNEANEIISLAKQIK